MQMTTMLLGAGALALAACAAGEKTTVPVAEEGSSGAMTAVNQPVSAAPAKPTPSSRAAPVTQPAPKDAQPSAPAKEPRPEQAASKPLPKSDPSPPAKEECPPEHKEMGHC